MTFSTLKKAHLFAHINCVKLHTGFKYVFCDSRKYSAADSIFDIKCLLSLHPKCHLSIQSWAGLAGPRAGLCWENVQDQKLEPRWKKKSKAAFLCGLLRHGRRINIWQFVLFFSLAYLSVCAIIALGFCVWKQKVFIINFFKCLLKKSLYLFAVYLYLI